MISRNNILCLGALTMLSIFHPTESHASLTQEKQLNMACIENNTSLLTALESINYVVEQEAKDSTVLVDFGYLSAYLHPKDGLALYDERIQYLQKISNILGCNSLQNSKTTRIN